VYAAEALRGVEMTGLILDDDYAVCEYIASALEESGVGHEIFLDPMDALDRMGQRKYEFAFIDIKLPKMDGFAFCKRFKSSFPEADIIFITGYGDYEKAVQAIKVGAYDYIKKPFRRLDISLCVARLVEKRHLYQSQKRMEMLKFANEVALELMHELRTPLVSIGGFSRLITRKDLPEDRLKEFTRTIFEETVRMEKVLEEILAHLMKAAVKPDRPGEDTDRLIPAPENKGAAPASLEDKALGEGFSRRASDYQDEREERNMKKSHKKRPTIERTTSTAGGVATKEAISKEAPVNEAAGMNQGIKKEYVEDEKLCKVTFRLPGISALAAKRVCIVGDFNNWDVHQNPMKKMENGDYVVTLDLAPGKEYQFRYLIDESRWENAWNADKYVKNPYGDSDNSVVVL
jgi:FixJ family two-component response regulator